MELKNKKAFFFTSISVLMLALLILVFKPTPSQLELEKIPIIENRVLTVNDYVRELNYDYIPKAIIVSSKSALKSYSIKKIDEKKFSDNDGMKKEIYNLMVYGNYSDNSKINNFSLKNLLNNITKMINDSMNIETKIKFGNLSNFEIYQDETTGPWKIGINYSLGYEVESNFANWNVTLRHFSVMVHIDELPDAYLAINSDKDVNIRNITQASNLSWNFVNFEEHLKNKTYTWSNKSPNFLSRLINDTTSSKCCGIYTFVGNESDIGSELGSFHNRSFVDYCYFSKTCDDNLFKIDGISTDYDDDNYTYPFRIDEFYLKIYKLSLYSKID